MNLITLSELSSPEMASIAASAHSHPMTESNIKSCFGDLYRCIGINERDELCGFAILHQIFEEATLMDICINPVHQGKGYGKALLDAVQQQARESGAEILLLEVRESAIAARSLYVNAGFEQSGRRKGYYKTADGSEDAILMSLSIISNKK